MDLLIRSSTPTTLRRSSRAGSTSGYSATIERAPSPCPPGKSATSSSTTYRDPIKMDKNKLKFRMDPRPPPHLVEALRKTPYVGPDIEEDRQNINEKLDKKLRVDVVQFGVLYWATYPRSGKEPLQARFLSIEWQRELHRQAEDTPTIYLSFHRLETVVLVFQAVSDSTSSNVMPFINTVVLHVLGRKKSDIPPNPSRRGPDSIAQNSPSGYIPRNILAFRTITKLLSMLQKEPVLPVEDVKLQEHTQHLELKLTSTFATLAVIEHEIVAVAHTIDSETLGLIACNFRHSDKDPKAPVLPEPTIINAEVLANLGLVGDQAIKQYADEYIRPPIPLKRHTTPLTAATGDFTQQVKKALLYGYAIQRLAHGAALKMHLKTIESQLRYYNASHPREPQPQKPGKEEEELDEDVAAVCQSVSDGGTTISLIDSYIDWFRLLIAHFDAVDILVRFVTGPHFRSPTISVDILVAPPVDQTLLPWRELLADSTLLPTDASDEEEAQTWMQCETRLVRCADAIRMHYKVYGTTPPKPSSFGFDRAHKTHGIARRLVAVARDWFIIWMGFLSYLIAQSRANPFNWPDCKQKDWGQKGALPKWYMVLRQEGFPEDWLSGLLTSDVCDFSRRTPRAGIVVDWTCGNIFTWSRIISSGGKEIFMRTRVEKRRHDNVFNEYTPAQCRYNALENEWDLFEEFALEVKSKNGQDYVGYEHSDSEDDGFDPFEGYEHLYVSEDQNVSPTSPDGIPPSGASPGASPASPEPDEVAVPMDAETNLLVSLRLMYGFNPSPTAQTPHPQAPNLRSWSDVLGVIGTKSEPDVSDRDKVLIREFISCLIDSSSGLPAPSDNLNATSDQPLATSFALDTVERISEDLYVFKLPPSPSCKWVIGVDRPTTVLYICRLVASTPNTHMVLTIAYHLLEHHIPFRTLLLQASSEPEQLNLPYADNANRFNKHQFTTADFDSAMLECRALLGRLQGRAAILRGGIVGRIAREFGSKESGLQGPSIEVTVHHSGYFVPSKHDGYFYWDDDLTGEEIACLCGTYCLYTGCGEQTTTVSWFPPPDIWDKQGYGWPGWTETNEEFFQQWIADIRKGNAKPLSRQNWWRKVHSIKNTRSMLKNNRERAKAYVELNIHAM
ncbi:unnamed protein product [Cyclocybe aegerita]|uniref:Uncharacterized protein n=1 Tax=Cyclocybe aegerita TaxID=1973307 RepID=A0A8S0VW46_CYCAE|nr:unnamed protein product [Cyclocybe aegerita]